MLKCLFLWSSRSDGGSFSWNSQGDCLWFYLKLLTTNVLCVHVVAFIKALCFCCSFITCALVLIMLFFISWPSCIVVFGFSSTFDPLMLLPCTAPQVLTLLHCYTKLLLSFWPSCIVVLCCSLILDPLALLRWTIPQLLTFLCCCIVLLLNSWPSYVATLIYSSTFNVMLLLNSWPSCVATLHYFSILDLLALCVTL